MGNDDMRVLTVRQPWAWAIIHGGKDVENRSRNIAGDYRGPVAIHAGKRFKADEIRAACEAFPTLAPDVKDRIKGQSLFGGDPLYVGAIIGVVDLIDSHWARDCFGYYGTEIRPCSEWAELNARHLTLARPRPIEPIPAKGKLGLWRPDDELHQAIDTALSQPLKPSTRD